MSEASNYTTTIPRLSTINRDKYLKRKAERAMLYKQEGHGQKVSKFYNSYAWKNARNAYIQEHPLCELSLIEQQVVSGENVHHIVKFIDQPTEELQWRLFLDPDNLMTLSAEMHQMLHKHRADLTQAQLVSLQNRKDALFEKYLKLGVCIALPND